MTILRDIKITAIKLPPKRKKLKVCSTTSATSAKVDQVKFVKPVERQLKLRRSHQRLLKSRKKLGAETIKGPDAVLSVAPVGNGPKQQVVEEDNQIYNNAGIEVKPEFPGGWINLWLRIKKLSCAGRRGFER
jgi:protein TonB